MNYELGKNTSVWIDTTSQTNHPPLAGDLEVDVAIIGGGISGLTASYFLKKAGLKVVVLESEKIVTGTTGFTTAKITSAHGLIYKYLIDKFGQEKAQIYADANETAKETMIDLMAGLNIDADVKRLPSYTYAVSRDDIDKIEDEVKAAKNLGLPVNFTTDLPLPYTVTAAIKYDNQARYHPRKYLLGLAAKIDGGGTNIFEQTRVLKIEKGKPCQIKTDKHTIAAKYAIIATNYPIYDPDSYFARLSARQSLVIAAKLNKPVPQGLFYSTEKSFHSLRPQPYEAGEVLLSGGKVFKTGQGGDIMKEYEELVDWTRKNFEVESIKYHWTTNDSESYDRVPLIGPIDHDSKNIFVATGFNGWGMAHGTVAGIILSDLILGQENPWEKLYRPRRLSNLLSGRGLKSNVDAISRLVKGKITHKPLDLDLANDEAKVIEHDGKKMAVYRDETGEVHAISAVCTHMGCTVAWNNAEKTWDCPCHGSRYKFDGTVIHGPAVKNLEKKELK